MYKENLEKSIANRNFSEVLGEPCQVLTISGLGKI